jgi:hypothetical protein
MIRTGGVALGNLSLEVSRTSGFYPYIFMGYPEPLRQLHQLGVVEPQARFFCKNRGVALLVRKGNPLGIRGLADVIHAGTSVALPDTGDVRAKCLAATGALLRKPAVDALVAAEVSFPGRLGIMHRDLPEMVARGYADVAFTWYHLVSYWARIFPNHFEFRCHSGRGAVLHPDRFGPRQQSTAFRCYESFRRVLLQPGKGRLPPL